MRSRGIICALCDAFFLLLFAIIIRVIYCTVCSEPDRTDTTEYGDTADRESTERGRLIDLSVISDSLWRWSDVSSGTTNDFNK